MRTIAKVVLCCGLALLTAALSAPPSEACSVFRVTAKDGTIMSGRTMEFGSDLKPGLIAVPRGRKFVSRRRMESGTVLDVTLRVRGDERFRNRGGRHGRHERGGTHLQRPVVRGRHPVSGRGSPGPGQGHCPHDGRIWILGRFATVGEAVEALRNVRVFSLVVPQMGKAPPGHFILYDAKGAASSSNMSGGSSGSTRTRWAS